MLLDQTIQDAANTLSNIGLTAVIGICCVVGLAVFTGLWQVLSTPRTKRHIGR